MLPHEGEIRWLCRRGQRELDVIFSGFLSDVYPTLDGNGKQSFITLLGEQDPVIMDWLFSRTQAATQDMRAIVAQLQGYCGLNKTKV